MLSQRQFNKTDVAKKPGSSYGGYVRWVTRTRAQRAAGGGGGGVGALARGDVDAQVNAQLAGLRSATRYGQQQAQHQAARAQGFAKALAALTATSPATAEKTYVDAANRLQSFGHGLTGDVLTAQQAEAARSASEVAQATGGQGQLVGYDPANLRTVGQYGGVTLPAESLSTEAARAKIQAGRLRDANVAQVGTIAQQYLAKVTDLQNQLAAKRAEVEQTRPSLYRQALSARQAAARDEETQRMQRAAAELERRQTLANLTGYDPVTGQLTESARASRASERASARSNTSTLSQPDASLSNSVGYLVNGNGRPIPGPDGRIQILPGNHWDAKLGRVVPDVTTTATGPGGLTPYETARRADYVGKVAKGSFLGVKNPNYDENFARMVAKGDIKPGDKGYNVARLNPWSVKPREASDVIADLRSRGYPYPMIYKALLGYAKLPGTRWDYLLDWQGPKMGGLRGTPGHMPKPKKKRK